jgi:hypothetical protein
MNQYKLHKIKTKFLAIPTVLVQGLIKDFNKITAMLLSGPALIITKSGH